MEALLAGLVPQGVEVSEIFDDPADLALFPEEEAVIARAVEKRRREYASGRHCARTALIRLGFPPLAIASGPNREPLWPEGVVGSITHCDGYRGAAVAHRDTVTSLGIDAEPHAPLPKGVLGTIARADEQPHLAGLAEWYPSVRWDRLVFSAKESVYKAWFPVAGRWLGFHDASVVFRPDDGSFEVTIHQPGAPLRTMSGLWHVEAGLVLTAVTVP